MRGLTHFLDFMDGMEEIQGVLTWKECLRYYHRMQTLSSDWKQEQDTEDIYLNMQKRLENLKRFEEYISEYWCPYYLTVEQQELYENIRKTPLGNKTTRIISLLEKYREGLNVRGKEFAEVEYQLNSWILDEELKEQRVFFVFLLVYFSIYKNRMAMYDFLQEDYMRSIQALYKGNYVKFEFFCEFFHPQIAINYTKFKQIADKEIAEGHTGSYLSRMEKLFFRKSGRKCYFDIFGPISVYMQEFDIIPEQIMMEDQERISEQLLLSQSMLQIVLNNELKQKIQIKLQEKVQEKQYFSKSCKLIPPTEVIKEIYQSVDESVGELGYLNLTGNMLSFISREGAMNDTFVSLALICNEQIAQFYFDHFKKELQRLIPSKLGKKTEVGLMNALNFSISIKKILPTNFVAPRDWEINDIVLNNDRIGVLFAEWNNYVEKVGSLLKPILEKGEGAVTDVNDIRMQATKSFVDDFNALIEQWKVAIKELVYNSEG